MFHCKLGQVLRKVPPPKKKKVCKSEKGKYCILMHEYGIQKDVTDEPICKAEMEMQTQRTDYRLVDTVGEERVGPIERIAWRHINELM